MSCQSLSESQLPLEATLRVGRAFATLQSTLSGSPQATTTHVAVTALRPTGRLLHLFSCHLLRASPLSTADASSGRANSSLTARAMRPNGASEPICCTGHWQCGLHKNPHNLHRSVSLVLQAPLYRVMCHCFQRPCVSVLSPQSVVASSAKWRGWRIHMHLTPSQLGFG